MINFNCQLWRVCHHLGEGFLNVLVGDFLDWVNCCRKIHPLKSAHIPGAEILHWTKRRREPGHKHLLLSSLWLLDSVWPSDCSSCYPDFPVMLAILWTMSQNKPTLPYVDFVEVFISREVIKTPPWLLHRLESQAQCVFTIVSVWYPWASYLCS